MEEEENFFSKKIKIEEKKLKKKLKKVRCGSDPWVWPVVWPVGEEANNIFSKKKKSFEKTIFEKNPHFEIFSKVRICGGHFYD
jgi:hypothetical protein